MYDYENSREAAGLENIGWKLNPHRVPHAHVQQERGGLGDVPPVPGAPRGPGAEEE